MKIEPVGSLALIEKSENKNYITESGIEVFQNQLSIGEIIEVSKDIEESYPVGSQIIYNAGVGIPQTYNGKQCLWIDCRAPEKGGHVIGKVTDNG